MPPLTGVCEPYGPRVTWFCIAATATQVTLALPSLHTPVKGRAWRHRLFPLEGLTEHPTRRRVLPQAPKDARRRRAAHSTTTTAIRPPTLDRPHNKRPEPPVTASLPSAPSARPPDPSPQTVSPLPFVYTPHQYHHQRHTAAAPPHAGDQKEPAPLPASPVAQAEKTALFLA